MDKVRRRDSDLGEAFSLSPEYWLSKKSADNLQDGVPLGQVAVLKKATTSSISDDALVLDTGNSDRGLLHLPVDSLSTSVKRISNKKCVLPGSVLISRLRPYLQQVSYIPLGINELLGREEILCSTEYYVLAGVDGDSIAYLVPWLLSDEIQAVFQQATTGGHHPRFSDDLLMRLHIPKSIYEDREKISKAVVEAVHQHIDAQLKREEVIRCVNSG